MPKIISFLKGPQIRVTLHSGKVSLSLANRFECEIQGVANETLLAFLTDYAQRKPGQVELPLDGLTPFRQKILKSLQKVAFGSVLTYGELALEAGHPGAARAVGTACHYNPFPLFIPCHRVIASGGKIGGFACDLEIKRRLLEFEGV